VNKGIDEAHEPTLRFVGICAECVYRRLLHSSRGVPERAVVLRSTPGLEPGDSLRLWARRRGAVWRAAGWRQYGTALHSEPGRLRDVLFGLAQVPTTCSSIYNQLRLLMLNHSPIVWPPIPMPLRRRRIILLLAETNRSGARTLQGVPMDHAGKPA
jgi:hypothetical protein